LIAVRAPIRRSPYGEFRKPFTPCHTAPPIAYVERNVSVGWQSQGDARAEAPDPESRDLKHKGVGKRKPTYPHTESSSKIIQCHPGAWVSCMIHLLECARSEDLAFTLLSLTSGAICRRAVYARWTSTGWRRRRQLEMRGSKMVVTEWVS
jgi:hypothetical protein